MTDENNKEEKKDEAVSSEDLNEAISKNNAEEESVKDEPESLEAKCAEYKAGWQRATADYANLKAQMEKQGSELSKYAHAELVRELLPTIEHLRQAAAHEPKPAEGDDPG